MLETELNQPPISYRPEGFPSSPYQKAAEEWDDRIGSARVQAKNWRILSLILSAAVINLTGGIVYLATTSHVVPYVVEVSTNGQVRAVGPANQIAYVPSRAVLEHFLAEWVIKVRAIPLDPIVAKTRWLSAYAYLRQSSANVLNAIAIKERPLERVGQETVWVDIKGVVPLSKDSYQVRWEESSFSKDGLPGGRKSMTGLFTVELDPPTDEKALKANPLGLFIKQFNWSQDF